MPGLPPVKAAARPGRVLAYTRLVQGVLALFGVAFVVGLATTSTGCSGPSGCGTPEPYCSGNSVMSPYYHSDEEVGYCVIDGETESPCGAYARCDAGRCVAIPPERPCPNGNGFCVGDEAFFCDHGGVPETGNWCGGLGLSCFEVSVGGGHVQPVCALSDEPCGSITGDSKCQGNERVRCASGYAPDLLTYYPVEVLSPCEGENVICVDSTSAAAGLGAQCTYSVPCPADGRTLCHDGVVHGCSGGDTTIRLRDCGSDVCVVRDARALCSVSVEGPPPSHWQPIPGGSFQDTYEDPTYDLAAFEMQEKEVTVVEYEGCVRAGACTPPLRECAELSIARSDLHADLPVMCVDFSQAQTYCASIGGRLPTDVEWLYVAKNAGQDVDFPWGDDDDPCLHTDCSDAEPDPGCESPDDVTTQGVCDLAGGVREFVVVEGAGGSALMGMIADGNGLGGLRALNVGEEFAQYGRGFRCVR